MAARFTCAGCNGRGVFATLPPAQRSRLAGSALPCSYRSRQTIFHEGTPSLAVHCIRSGTVKLSRGTAGGDEILVGIRSPGDVIGHRAVLADIPYGITAETLEPSVVCTIPRETFIELVLHDADLALRILRHLAREVCLVEEQLVERTRLRVHQRAARLLLRLARGHGPAAWIGPRLEITMNREQMALLVGTTPETLSRTLHALVERGILDLDRRAIRVRDEAALARLAEPRASAPVRPTDGATGS